MNEYKYAIVARRLFSTFFGGLHFATGQGALVIWLAQLALFVIPPAATGVWECLTLLLLRLF